MRDLSLWDSTPVSNDAKWHYSLLSKLQSSDRGSDFKHLSVHICQVIRIGNFQSKFSLSITMGILVVVAQSSFGNERDIWHLLAVEMCLSSHLIKDLFKDTSSFGCKHAIKTAHLKRKKGWKHVLMYIYTPPLSDINLLAWQQLSLTLWFVSRRSSHPFLTRLRSHTPKSSSDAGGMTDGNDAAQHFIHVHTHHRDLHQIEGMCFFFVCVCLCVCVRVFCQCITRTVALTSLPQPKQCQDRNAGSTLHCRQEK